MATVDELLALTVDAESEPHLVIGADRVITVPAELKIVAVQYDNNIETVTFDCPRYWDEHDFSTMAIFLEYTRPDKEMGVYACKNITVDENDDQLIHFTWTIDRHVTTVAGELTIQVVIQTINEDGNLEYRWGSIQNREMRIEPSMRATEVVPQKYPEVIQRMLTQLLVIEMDGVPTDWNASDGEFGYVENRTHYTEPVAGDAILAYTEHTFSPTTTEAGRNVAIATGQWTELVVGQPYFVKINGLTHKLVCHTDGDGKLRYLGNSSLYSSTDSYWGGSFCIVATPPDGDPNDAKLYIINSDNTVTKGTVGIYAAREVVHPLDEKYIPDSIARVGDVPSGGNSDISDEAKEELVALVLSRLPMYEGEVVET